MTRPHPSATDRGPASFTLLEMMLAIAIFSITVIGMVQGMNRTIRSSAMVTMASHVREQLNSRLVEARGRKLAGGMTATATDGRGVTYTTVAEPLKLRDRQGHDLPSLYRLRLTAKWAGPDGAQTESVEQYVYQASSTPP